MVDPIGYLRRGGWSLDSTGQQGLWEERGRAGQMSPEGKGA